MRELLVTFALPDEARPFRRRIAGRRGVRVVLTGVGRENATSVVRAALQEAQPSLVLTSGFAGALDPALQRGTVIYEPPSGAEHEPRLAPVLQILHHEGVCPARFVCVDRIAVTAMEKRVLRQSTGADAVEMESGAIRSVCDAAGVPCLTVRAISDAAEDDLPLDFNRLMRADRSLPIWKVLLEVARSPRLVKPLRELQRHAQTAAARLAMVLSRIADQLPPGEP